MGIFCAYIQVCKNFKSHKSRLKTEEVIYDTFFLFLWVHNAVKTHGGVFKHTNRAITLFTLEI